MSSAELSEGWGVEAWCSAIQPEPSHFFLVAIFCLVTRKRRRLRTTIPR